MWGPARPQGRQADRPTPAIPGPLWAEAAFRVSRVVSSRATCHTPLSCLLRLAHSESVSSVWPETQPGRRSEQSSLDETRVAPKRDRPRETGQAGSCIIY